MASSAIVFDSPIETSASYSRGSGASPPTCFASATSAFVSPAIAETIDRDLVARPLRLDHAPRDVPDALHVADAGAAELLDDQRHRCFPAREHGCWPRAKRARLDAPRAVRVLFEADLELFGAPSASAKRSPHSTTSSASAREPVVEARRLELGARSDAEAVGVDEPPERAGAAGQRQLARDREARARERGSGERRALPPGPSRTPSCRRRARPPGSPPAPRRRAPPRARGRARASHPGSGNASRSPAPIATSERCLRARGAHRVARRPPRPPARRRRARRADPPPRRGGRRRAPRRRAGRAPARGGPRSRPSARRPVPPEASAGPPVGFTASGRRARRRPSPHPSARPPPRSRRRAAAPPPGAVAVHLGGARAEQQRQPRPGAA